MGSAGPGRRPMLWVTILAAMFVGLDRLFGWSRRAQKKREQTTK